MHKKCKKHAQKCAIQEDIWYISDGFRGKKVQKLQTKLKKKKNLYMRKKQYSFCIVGFCIIWSCVGNKHLTIERENFFLLGQKRAAISGSQFPKQTLDQEAPEYSLPAFFPPKLRESHLNLNTTMVSSDTDNQTKQPQPKSQPLHLQPLQHQGETQVFPSKSPESTAFHLSR